MKSTDRIPPAINRKSHRKVEQRQRSGEGDLIRPDTIASTMVAWKVATINAGTALR